MRDNGLNKHIDQIKQDYIRLRANELGLWLEVCEIGWEGPHTPVSNWIPVKRLGQPPAPEEKPAILTIRCVEHGSDGWIVTPQELEQEIDKLLANRRYFRTCSHCGELCQKSHMFDKKTCNGCAEKTMGIVY